MNRTPTNHPRQAEAGFSLLEVTAAMGVMAILATGIFSLTAGSLELTDELSQFQNRHIQKKRFIELCRENLEAVPGHAKVEFQYDSNGGLGSYLSIAEHPFAFTFGGDTADIARVILQTDQAAGGYFRATLIYLNREENLTYEQGALDPSTIQRRVVLMRRLRQLSWRFYDTGRQQWFEYWDQPRNPTLIELSLAMEGEVTPERAVFWIPPEKAVSVGRGRTQDDENEDEDESEADEGDETEPSPDNEPPVRAP